MTAVCSMGSAPQFLCEVVRPIVVCVTEGFFLSAHLVPNAKIKFSFQAVAMDNGRHLFIYANFFSKFNIFINSLVISLHIDVVEREV
jgi:hypothetical protein